MDCLRDMSAITIRPTWTQENAQTSGQTVNISEKTLNETKSEDAKPISPVKLTEIPTREGLSETRACEGIKGRGGDDSARKAG